GVAFAARSSAAPTDSVPWRALARVRGRELPVLVRKVEASHEALLLLLLRDVQEELADRDAVPGRVGVEAVDVLIALLPDVLADDGGRQLLGGEELRVHPDHEDLLVVRAVEDADAAPLGEGLARAPHVVV